MSTSWLKATVTGWKKSSSYKIHDTFKLYIKVCDRQIDTTQDNILCYSCIADSQSRWTYSVCACVQWGTGKLYEQIIFKLYLPSGPCYVFLVWQRDPSSLVDWRRIMLNPYLAGVSLNANHQVELPIHELRCMFLCRPKWNNICPGYSYLNLLCAQLKTRIYPCRRPNNSNHRLAGKTRAESV